MTNGKLRWGILGPGRIARKFAQGLASLPDADLVAVGSRSLDRAKAFGMDFGVPRCHGSYEQLAADPEVDLIYVATPHPFHRENTILALRAGKHVLCEKPFAVNARQAADMIAVARDCGLFLMEAMWTRFLPVTRKVREWLDAGAIGQVRQFTADLGFCGPPDPSGRLLNPALAGGALLDVGIYTVSYASMLFGGPPADLHALAHMGTTGVDEQTAMVLSYPEGQLALLSCAVRTNTPQDGRIDGTAGRIRIPGFWRSTGAVLEAQGKEPERFDADFGDLGLSYQAAEAMRCVRTGQCESPVMPLGETLQIAETLDTIRARIGLGYPGEESEGDA
jgi:predicted dehydrogenase